MNPLTPEAFKEFINTKTTLMIAYDDEHITAQMDQEFYIYFNTDPEEIAYYGELEFSTAIFGADCQVHFLEKHFVDPLHPTPEELLLWELEHGYTYPLMRYMK